MVHVGCAVYWVRHANFLRTSRAEPCEDQRCGNDSAHEVSLNVQHLSLDFLVLSFFGKKIWKGSTTSNYPTADLSPGFIHQRHNPCRQFNIRVLPNRTSEKIAITSP